MVKFNVLLCNFNTGKPECYDIMPYFYREWKSNKKYIDVDSLRQIEVKTYDDFRKWFVSTAKYQFWARTEYEFIMVDWPYKEKTPVEKQRATKIDAWFQIEMNLDTIASAMWKDLGFTI